MRFGMGLWCLASAASMVFGQPAAGVSAGAPPSPAFEVASIKPNQRGKIGGEGSRREQVSVDPGRLTMVNVNLHRAICWAYDVKTYQVSGPGWLDEDRYDIMAKAPGTASEAELRAMLQHLLSDRFKLEFHRQQKELPVYALVVAKGGPKFHESKTEGEFSVTPTGKTSATFQRATVAQLVDMLTQVLRMPVLDETGLKGHYDVSVDLTSYLPDNFEHSNGPPPDIQGIVMSALPGLLGLKLESRKAALDMLMIDHAERAPLEN